jgi:FAD/FMN-containing dehydrogenase
MDRIERIDSKNLCVHIQRGVTFEQLDKALEPEGLTVLYPAASATRSVVCHAVSRGMFLAAAKYPEVQVTNMQVVLQDGAIHRTGSHANSEEMADWKEDGGPNLSKWYLGGDDIFGIVVRGSIWVYPRFQGRRFGAVGFGEQQRALKLLKELPRKELPQECLVMNRPAMARALAVSGEGLPLWALVTGVEGFPELADYQHRKIEEAVAREGGIPLGAAVVAGMEKHLRRPGYLPMDRSTTAFHCLFGRVAEFDAVLGSSCGQAGLSEESVGKTYIAHGLGRSVWCRYDLPPTSNGSSFAEGLESKLASAGAFFDRPQGQLAEQIYGTIPAYVRHVRKIKDLMDDRRILNPGKPVKEI